MDLFKKIASRSCLAFIGSVYSVTIFEGGDNNTRTIGPIILNGLVSFEKVSLSIF